ncbi:hypothetical protein SAMN04488696_1203 [Methanolobus profundi]|uniref:Uncharacterized protein n=1 Tax=Methanolobus profundi TaxID=487685 RepID=A0A1I4QUC9_9EURY|nr:hypothetical protein SAMN04488696_1203 [Methanolobus profundi]
MVNRIIKKTIIGDFNTPETLKDFFLLSFAMK